MIEKSILLIISIIDFVIILINRIVGATKSLQNRAVHIWKNIVIRKWAYSSLGIIDSIVIWIKKYLEDLRVVLKYRFYYQNVTGPMKNHYRELVKKRSV
ncbi:MAG TPA: hypothetical protein ENI15_19305 [Spirochaetes bacterium]|nr:hypothetical protein [Spirochaetota bacterium]